MPKPESFPIDKIYVPVKRKKALKPELVEEIAESILEIGQQAPILVRPDEGRLVLVDGLHRYLDLSAESRFLNSLKLETTGTWIGTAAPARLQIRLMEAAKSSQHPAYQAFRNGLSRSGGLEKAYPAAKI